MRKLIIIGARAHARELHEAVLASNQQNPSWDLLGFVAYGATQPELIAARQTPILGDLDVIDTMDPTSVDYIIGLGSARDRKHIDTFMTSKGFTAATVIHPRAVIGSLVTLGAGCYIAAQAVLTTAIALGRHVHVNVQASISHDCAIGDYSIINPGSHLAGVVTFGVGVEVGVGACFKPQVRVGEWSVIGAGAAVIKDVAPHTTVAGVPARQL